MPTVISNSSGDCLKTCVRDLLRKALPAGVPELFRRGTESLRLVCSWTEPGWCRSGNMRHVEAVTDRLTPCA